MPKQQDVTRYQALESFAATVAGLEVEESKSLPGVLTRLKRAASKVLKLKDPPRNKNLAEARIAAGAIAAEKARVFRAEIMPHILKARKDGAGTTRAIAGWLNERDIKTARGFKWSSGSVHRLIEGSADD